jgi:hypothetical protein
MSAALGRPVEAIEQTRVEWKRNAQQVGWMTQIDSLLKMFEYYDQYDLVVIRGFLENLLNRKPTTYKQFLCTHLISEKNNHLWIKNGSL